MVSKFLGGIRRPPATLLNDAPGPVYEYHRPIEPYEINYCSGASQGKKNAVRWPILTRYTTTVLQHASAICYYLLLQPFMYVHYLRGKSRKLIHSQ